MMLDSGDNETLDGDVGTLSTGIESLTEQAEKEEQKLKSLYELLGNIEVECASKSKNPDVSVLQNKYAMLKAELVELKGHEVEGIPLNKDLQVALLKQHMEQNTAGLKDFSEYLDVMKDKLVRKKEKLQEFLTMEKAVVSYPTGIEESQLEEVTPVSPVKEKISELKGKIKKMKTLKELRVSQVRILLERLYPRPSPFDVAETEKEDMNFGENGGEKKSLLEIIELLMNASLVSSNPWITVDSTMWDPYIELLTRTRIIIRHPSNNNLIKLEKFHE